MIIFDLIIKIPVLCHISVLVEDHFHLIPAFQR